MTAGLYTAALFATQYPDGGNFQWGAGSSRRWWCPVSRRSQPWGSAPWWSGGPSLAAPLAATSPLLVLVSSVGGVVALGTGREQVSRLYGDRRLLLPVNVTTSDLLPRLMWREDLPWLRARPADLETLLERLPRRRCGPGDGRRGPGRRGGPGGPLGAVAMTSVRSGTPLHIVVVRQ